MLTSSLHPPHLLRLNTNTPHQPKSHSRLDGTIILDVRLYVSLPHPVKTKRTLLQK